MIVPFLEEAALPTEKVFAWKTVCFLDNFVESSICGTYLRHPLNAAYAFIKE